VTITSCRKRKGFTLLEMLTTVAVLILVLGMMVSLAHYVRNELAVEATKDVLHRLDTMMQQYAARQGHLPAIEAFIPPGLAQTDLPDEQILQQTAVGNNRGFVAALREAGILQDESFGGLPQSLYNDMMIRDAWGSPIVFMPAMHEGIGIALENRPFFFSAGPDQLYLTQENNLYSYEKEGLK
jgi:type II secretory pathway pseudopilin PulG